MNELIKNLPIELQEKIYNLDDTYKPSFDNKKWFDLHMALIDKAQYYWFRRYPAQAPKILFDWYNEPTEDDFDESDDESDEESDEEENQVLTIEQYLFS